MDSNGHRVPSLMTSSAIADDLADGLADGLPHQALTTTLIEHGANLERRSGDDFTALHVGCVLGHAGCVRLLVAAAADVHARATLGATPLILAASRGHHDVCKVLLEAGAVLSAIDELGMVAAYYAQVSADDL